MRKGQAAMEFLMTYGWAILVVLVAIGALAYFGVLSPEQFLPEKCTISTGSGLFCIDHSAVGGTADAITLRTQNILTDSVTIAVGGATVSFTGSDGTAETCTNNAALTLTADQTDNLVLDTCTGLAVGEKVKGDISITYTKAGGLTKTTTGSLVTVAG
ncbi:MAG: hypothetical protein Q8O03_04790 [Nanoarchaeota archaeon]|nr:hypothetical protein [Nanoarchaeota archaeon]